jgi:hypothetical protein
MTGSALVNPRVHDEGEGPGNDETKPRWGKKGIGAEVQRKIGSLAPTCWNVEAVCVTS